MTEPTHILVVDEDTETRYLLQKTFVEVGYRVSLAASGEEAQAYLQLITPDLILLDLLLPDVDGLDLTRNLKADTSKLFIPIIIITERTDLEASVMSLDAGADDFLVKPLAVDELLARVRAMLRLQRTQRSLQNEQRKTELLLHLTRELGASIELDTLLTRFLDHLADSVGAVRASIILLDEDKQSVCYSSSRNPATPLLSDILRQGVAGWVIRERVPLIIDDTRNDPRWIGNTNYHSNVRSVAAMPVLREGRTLAVITLVHHTPRYFNAQHIELLNSVAAQSAVALQSAQLFSLTQRQKELLGRRADELRRINEISAFMSELMQPEQLLRLVAYMIHQQFDYPQVHLLMCEGEELVLHASAGIMRSELPAMLRFPVSQGLTGWAIRQQQITRVDDVHTDARFISLLPDDAAIRSEIVLPIILRGEVLGTLNVQSPVLSAFGPNEEAILSAIVSQLSIALGNARLLENEQWRIRQLNQVNKLSVAITEQLDAIQNLHLAAESVARAFGVEQAGLVLLDNGEGPEHILVALHGGTTVEDELFIRRYFARSDVQALLHKLRAPRIVTDVQSMPVLQALHPFFHAYGITALIVVPLLTGTQVMGVIGIDATGWEERIGNADLELATTIASLVIQVIDNARLYRAVEDERSTLNAVLRGAADPILLVGPEDELLLTNRAAEERFHLDLKRNRGKPLTQLDLNGYGNLVLNELLPLLSVNLNRDTIGQPNELVLPNQEITYSVSVAPVRSTDGQPIGRVAVLQDISAIKALERQERDRVRSVFRRYVSPPVAEQLLCAGEEWGHPTERQVAVLFADLRGFTSMTERIDPHVLIERILNRYFNAMTEVLYDHDGTIDKFLGDGIIGVFGTPISRPDDPQRALHAAIDMQQALAQLRIAWCQELGLDIGMGIGISFGRAVVGNIGSEQRLDYTLIGDVVNTASRLSNITRSGQIIVSHNLHSALPPNWDGRCQLHPLGAVSLKGKQEPHQIFEVLY